MKLADYLSHGENWVFLSFCVAALVQIFYYLFFFTRLAFFRAAPRVHSQTHPVSVIICARDEAANLTKNLPGVLIQQYATSHEVIVVNDNSFDESKYILEAYQKAYRQLHIVELKQEARFINGKKFPLSMGIKSARHEIVLLTDADCVPASEFWVDKMQQHYQDGIEIVIGYGALHRRKGVFNKLVRWETMHTALQYLSYCRAGMTYMGVGRNLSYKKNLFFRQKGFSAHNHLPGGDDDLFINAAATRRNTAIAIDPDTFTLTDPPSGWRQWIRQKNRHYTTSKYYKGRHKFLLGLYALSHFVYYPLFIAALLVHDYRDVLAVFGIRLLIQAVILFRVSRKLSESDLFPWFLILDAWMFLYYLIFSRSLFKRPRPAWN